MNAYWRGTVGILIAVAFWPVSGHSQTPTDKTVAAHVRELKDKDVNVRLFAADSLGKLGEQSLPAVPALIEALADQDQSVRRYAVIALGKIGPKAKPAVSALTDYLRSEDEESGREAALEALQQMAPDVVTKVPDLIEGLKSSDLRRRRWSVEALSRLEEKAAPALNELIAALQDKDPTIRAAVTVALRNLRETARPAVGPLVQALQDSDSRVRENAAEALGWVGPGADTVDAVPHLIKAMSDAEPRVRSNAARAFLTEWPGGQRAIPALIKALDDGTASGNAGYSLKHLARHGHSKVVVPALIEYLQQRGGTGDWSAITTLGDIGPDAKAAIPALDKKLKSEQAEVRGAAASAINKIGGVADTGVQRLIADLRSNDYITQERALQSLGDIGPAASAAVPELISRLSDRNRLAFEKFQLAAEKGLPEAQYALALQFRDGEGTAPDMAACVSWLKKAADQGHREAQRQMGIMYRQGRGVPQDERLADHWYRLSVKSSGALARLRDETVFQPAYDNALRPHQMAQPEFGVGRGEKLILAVTTFNVDATQAHHNQVTSTGAVRNLLDIYNRGTRGFGDYKLSSSEIERLHALVKLLPEGVQFVPLQQKMIVSYSIAGRWTTRSYDTESLPHSMRLLLDLVDAPADSVPYPPQERTSWISKPEPAKGLAYQPDGTLCYWNSQRRLFHWKEGQSEQMDDDRRDPLGGRPIAVAMDRVVTKEAQQLRLWDAKSGKFIADLGEGYDSWYGPGEALFSADGKTLAVQQYQHHRVHIWDAPTGTKRGVVEVGEFSNRPMAISTDGQQLALSFAKNKIRIWDLQTFEQRQEIEGSGWGGLCFSPDGTCLAGIHQYLAVWDLPTGKKRFETYAGSWAGMPCFTPDGTIITGQRQRRLIKLWDARDGRILGLAEGHTLGLTALAISPDGKEMASASEDGAIKVWNINAVIGKK